MYFGSLCFEDEDDDDDNDDGFWMSEEPVALPINGILDLHTFSPKEIKHLIPDYIDECLVNNIFQLRIIHGKGIGNLRRTVHSILDKHPAVKSYHLAGQTSGGWGATEVDLRNVEEK